MAIKYTDPGLGRGKYDNTGWDAVTEAIFAGGEYYLPGGRQDPVTTVPMGRAPISVGGQGTGIPWLGSEIDWFPPLVLPGTPSRSKPVAVGVAPPPQFLQTTKRAARDWFEYHANPGELLPPTTASRAAGQAALAKPVVVPVVKPPPIVTKKPDAGAKPMDLGTIAVDLIGQLGTAYIQSKAQPSYAQPVSYAATSPLTGIQTQPALNIPFFGDDVALCPKRKRRRRRSLVTDSELSQLASLKSILTPAELKVWLATHKS